jgi:nucleotide-binding universal stress UspA family protein
MADQNIIVLPVDFSALSEEALPWVRRMAAVLNAEIHCIFVVESPHFYGSLDMTTPIAIPTAEEIAESINPQLHAFVDKHLGGQQPAATGKVLIGRPADMIVGYARDCKAAMIIMTTHGYGGVRHVLLGSTTEAVLRHAECPVLSVRSS